MNLFVGAAGLSPHRRHAVLAPSHGATRRKAGDYGKSDDDGKVHDELMLASFPMRSSSFSQDLHKRSGHPKNPHKITLLSGSVSAVKQFR